MGLSPVEVSEINLDHSLNLKEKKVKWKILECITCSKGKLRLRLFFGSYCNIYFLLTYRLKKLEKNVTIMNEKILYNIMDMLHLVI